LGKLLKLADYLPENSAHNIDWVEAFREHLEEEERSDNTIAGHESLETTRRYCQPSYHDLEKAVQVIGEEED
jgi:hypothetical protein